MPRGSRIGEEFKSLPADVTAYVRRVVKMIGYRRKVRREVRAELLAHFADALEACSAPEERQAKAEQLIAQFGDAQLLAILCRRAKKRCRSIWAKVFGGGRMAIFLLAAYTAWFASGKPVVSNSYLVALNQPARYDRPRQDNAWLYYRRAMSLVIEPNEPLDSIPGLTPDDVSRYEGLQTLSQEQQQGVKEWLESNEEAWRQLLRATRTRYFLRQYTYDGSRGAKLPTLYAIAADRLLSRLRVLATVCVWKARLASENGRVEEAFEDCLILAQAGARWQTCRMLVDQLHGLHVGGTARGEIARLVYCSNVSTPALADLQARLTALYPEGYPPINFEGERLAVPDGIQHLFTRGGWGGGHLIPGAFTAFLVEAFDIPDTPRSRLFRIVIRPVDIGASMIHARRRATEARGKDLHDQMRERSELSPFERHVQGIGGLGDELGFLDWFRYSAAYVLLPDEAKCSRLRFRGKMHHEATITILALKRYRLATGGYPRRLQELVEAGYIDRLPMDVYSDGPLVYRRTDNDFVLYSVYEDFTDDGGQPGLNDEGRPTLLGADWVFWPVSHVYEVGER